MRHISLIVAVTVVVVACGSPSGSPQSGAVATPPTASPCAAAPQGSPGAPAARGYHQMVALGERGVLMFGGSTANPARGRGLTDAWIYRDGSRWTEVGAATAPTSWGDAVGYDAKSTRVIALSIAGRDFSPLDETWIYDVCSDRWEKRDERDRPLALHGSRAIYVPTIDRLMDYDGIGDMWTYDVDTETWTRKVVTGKPAPRKYTTLVYDEAADRVILFGGGGDRADTWAYDPNTDTWKEMTPAKSPPGRLYHAMAYDPRAARTILFGGVVQSRAEQPLGDTWAYDYQANTWTELQPAAAPSARGWHSMAHDASRGTIVLFGGGVDRGRFRADTWIYDAERNVWAEAE